MKDLDEKAIIYISTILKSQQLCSHENSVITNRNGDLIELIQVDPTVSVVDCCRMRLTELVHATLQCLCFLGSSALSPL